MRWSWFRIAAAVLALSGIVAGFIVNIDRASREKQDLELVLLNYFSLFTIVSSLLSVIALVAAATWMQRHPGTSREPLGIALALAAVAGLRGVARAAASFELSHSGGGKVHVVGRVTARVGQTCVVSLDPIENDIDEPVDLMFAPEADIPRLSTTVDDEAESEDIPDSPEPIINGVIDLGRVATDVLFLGIDPYPRKPDAVFEQPMVAADPEDHPFAALKALKEGGTPPDSD